MLNSREKQCSCGGEPYDTVSGDVRCKKCFLRKDITKPQYIAGENEVRVTSATGGQKGQKSARFGGSDPLAMMELARVYGMGEEKYDRYNYLKGYDWSLSVDALFRHLFAFLAGENYDDESGLLHTAHVAWHALTLTSFVLRDVGTDNRAPMPDEPEPDTLVPNPWDKRWPLVNERCDHGVVLTNRCNTCVDDG